LLFGPLLRAAGSVERPLFPTEMDFKATGSGFFRDPGAKKAGYPANFSRRAVARVGPFGRRVRAAPGCARWRHILFGRPSRPRPVSLSVRWRAPPDCLTADRVCAPVPRASPCARAVKVLLVPLSTAVGGSATPGVIGRRVCRPSAHSPPVLGRTSRRQRSLPPRLRSPTVCVQAPLRARLSVRQIAKLWLRASCTVH